MHVLCTAGSSGLPRQFMPFPLPLLISLPPMADDRPDAPNRSDAANDLRPAYRRAYEAVLHTARKGLGERFRLVRLARKAYRKTLDEEDAVGAVKKDLLALVRLVRSWAGGDYRQVSPKTILSVVGAVLYFVSPLDAIPDFIPVVGLADDVAVVAAVVRSVRGDLERFRQWEAEQGGASSTAPAKTHDDAALPSASPASGDGASSPS